jgi:hypothetical protein
MSDRSTTAIDESIGTQASPSVPVSIVPAEGDANGINLGITSLVVPAEEIGVDRGGEDLDFSAQMLPSIRKPDRTEWFTFDPTDPLLVHLTRLLAVQTGPGGFESRYFYVDPVLRRPIFEQIRDVQVVLFWSLRDKRWGLWIVNVNPDNGWYQSLAPFLGQPSEFYLDRKFRIESDRSSGRYRIWGDKLPDTVKLPVRPTRPVPELLGAALGPQGFIRSADHPIYQQLIAGEELF